MKRWERAVRPIAAAICVFIAAAALSGCGSSLPDLFSPEPTQVPSVAAPSPGLSPTAGASPSPTGDESPVVWDTGEIPEDPQLPLTAPDDPPGTPTGTPGTPPPDEPSAPPPPAPSPSGIGASATPSGSEGGVRAATGSARSAGYAYCAAMPRVTCYFRSDFPGDMEAAALLCEELLAAAADLVPGASPPKTVYFVKSGAKISGGAYYIDQKNPVGFIFSSMSGGRLPYWLCAGTELCLTGRSSDPGSALSDGAARGMPDFGDLWFVPDFFADGDKGIAARAADIAGAFADALMYAGELDGVVKSLLAGQTASALGSRWVAFSGGLHGYDDSSSLVWSADGWRFSVKTPEALYTFYREAWKWADVRDYIPYMDASIAFAEKWTGIEYKQRVSVRLFPPDGKKTGGVAYFMPPDQLCFTDRDTFFKYGPYVTAHEVTHLLASHGGLERGMTPEFMREGFAMLAAYLCDLESPGYFYSSWQSSKPYETHFDYVARRDFDGVTVSQALLGVQNDLGVEIGELSTYYQAGSFVLWLYNTYGKEKLLEFYSDYYSCEALYGTDIYGLVGLWRNYLGLN